MNARHLPSDETLAGFAAGRLDEGMSLVVAAHVEMIVDLAIVAQHIAAVCAEHRLVPRRRQIDDRKPAMRKRDPRVAIATSGGGPMAAALLLAKD